MSDFLTVGDVVSIHSVLIEKYGGLDGIRDAGLLESAVYRPQNGFYRDIVEEAASLLESLLINHPFIDGNKRTAYGACAVFLKMNGRSIHATSIELYDMIMDWLSSPAESRFDKIVRDMRRIVT